jgi:hypothetical protein
MLTVLVKKPDGTEAIYTCNSVVKEHSALLMRHEMIGDGSYRGLEYIGPGGFHLKEWNFEGHELDLKRPPAVAFVMNDTGKTIARYSLFDAKIKDTEPLRQITPFPANDVKNVIAGIYDDKVYYLAGKTVSLLDLGRDTTLTSFAYIDRTALVALDGTIDDFIIKIYHGDKYDLVKITSYHPNEPVVFSRKKSVGDSVYTFGDDCRRVVTLDNQTRNIDGESITVLSSLPSNSSIQFGINFLGEIDVVSGLMYVNSVITGGDRETAGRFELHSYSATMFYDYEI